MDLNERIQKLKEIRSYIDDIEYYTLKPKTINASILYDYLNNIIKEFKKEIKNSKSE